MDELLLLLKSLYPNLQRVVFASHSAGSQFLQRYAALTRIDSHPAMQQVHIRFLVSDPSSYLYFDQERPRANGTFKPIDLNACPEGNRYHYGLDDIVAYGARHNASALRQRYFVDIHAIYWGPKIITLMTPYWTKDVGQWRKGAIVLRVV